MTIYIDVVLIENLIMNYIILLATGIILKEKINHIRLITSSFIGAIYTVVSYMNILEVYSNNILKIILSVIIIYIAFNSQTLKKMLKQLLIFYLTSFAFGGAAFALIYIVKPQDILMKNGLFLGTYPLKTIILATIITFIIIITAFKVVKTKISKKDMYCDSIVEINHRNIKVKTMIDTGNLLRDPLTQKPVMVIEKTSLYEVLPKEILNNLENILGGDLEKIPQNIQTEYMPKLKFIPFSSLGKQNGMLIGIQAHKVTMYYEDTPINKENIIIGIYDKSLTKKGEYKALIGVEMLGEWKNENYWINKK